MHLKIFTDENKLEEYLQILKYSLGRSGEITERLHREIQDGLIYTKNLPQTFKLMEAHGFCTHYMTKKKLSGQ